MRIILRLGLVLFALIFASCQAHSQAVPLADAPTRSMQAEAVYALTPELGQSGSNFAPQGLGYDAATGSLLFVQQGSSSPMYQTDLTGMITGTVPLDLVNVTSVAADETNFYVSDFTRNTRGADVFAIDRETGAQTQIGGERRAYAGYPIDVRDGQLYRTETSVAYSWGALNQLRISDLASPDTITLTLSLDTPEGISDIAVDVQNNVLWTLDYSSSAMIRRFDLTTGAAVDRFDTRLDGLDAGLTVADGVVYYYDWISGGQSTLSVFEPPPPTIPLPAGFGLLLGGCCTFWGLRRAQAAQSTT